MSADAAPAQKPRKLYDSPEMGATADLYRVVVYRSTDWRTRLENTINRSIVTMAIALSTTFFSRDALPVRLLVVGLLLAMEEGRYRYFNVWPASARWMEEHLCAPMLTGETQAEDGRCGPRLAQDYVRLRHNFPFVRAAVRRLRRSYLWILTIQGAGLFRKVGRASGSGHERAVIRDRVATGSIQGWDVRWIALALSTLWRDWRKAQRQAQRFDGVA